MSPDTREFHLREYESLRTRVASAIKEYLALERYVVFAVGVTWAFLYVHPEVPWWTYFIPTLFAFLGGIRARGIYKLLSTLHGYLKHLEHLLNQDAEEKSLRGWEDYRASQGREMVAISGAVPFWVCVIVATLVVVFLKHKNLF